MGIAFIINNADFSSENIGVVTQTGKRWFIEQSDSDMQLLATRDGLDAGIAAVFSSPNSTYTNALSGKTIYKLMIPIKPKKILSDTLLKIGTVDTAMPNTLSWGSDLQTIDLSSYEDSSAGLTDAEFVLIELQTPLYIPQGSYLQLQCTTSGAFVATEKESANISDYANSFAPLYIVGTINDNPWHLYFNNYTTTIKFYGE